MRYLLFAACLATTLLALLSWVGNRGLTTHETVTRENRSIQRPGGGSPEEGSTVHRVVVEPTSSLRSEALTITLATVAATLLLAVAFWDRLSEFRIGNMWFKLLDAKRVRQIRERTDDPDKALEAWELYLDMLGEAADEGKPVNKELADAAAEAAVREVQLELAEEVKVVPGEPPRIRIEGEPSEEQALWATSEPQYLPRGQFPPSLIEEVQGESANGRHCIYLLDELEVLAAVSYEAPPSAPLLVHAVATRNDRRDLQATALAAAMLATRYLHVVSQALDRPPGLAIATDRGRTEPVTLQELGFRKAHAEETPGLPPGDYWIQSPPEGGLA